MKNSNIVPKFHHRFGTDTDLRISHVYVYYSSVSDTT